MDVIHTIVGPTASGKTERAVRLAAEIGGEIVSADSVQIYRHLNIGTAKATPAELKGIRCHMTDVAEPDERYSAAEYQKAAYACIRDITARGRKVVVAGGTGLYISALVYNIRYPANSEDPEYRARLEAEAESSGGAALHAALACVDPSAAAAIHINDLKRIIRALEIHHTTGIAKSEHDRLSRLAPPEYEFVLTGLNAERSELYRRIDGRVDRMLRDGLVEEARFILDRYGRGARAFQAIGYKELLGYFDGFVSLQEAAETIKRETRRYAKRQLTWFRSMKEVNWINI